MARTIPGSGWEVKIVDEVHENLRQLQHPSSSNNSYQRADLEEKWGRDVFDGLRKTLNLGYQSLTDPTTQGSPQSTQCDRSQRCRSEATFEWFGATGRK